MCSDRNQRDIKSIHNNLYNLLTKYFENYGLKLNILAVKSNNNEIHLIDFENNFHTRNIFRIKNYIKTFLLNSFSTSVLDIIHVFIRYKLKSKPYLRDFLKSKQSKN